MTGASDKPCYYEREVVAVAETFNAFPAILEHIESLEKEIEDLKGFDLDKENAELASLREREAAWKEFGEAVSKINTSDPSTIDEALKLRPN